MKREELYFEEVRLGFSQKWKYDIEKWLFYGSKKDEFVQYPTSVEYHT